MCAVAVSFVCVCRTLFFLFSLSLLGKLFFPSHLNLFFCPATPLQPAAESVTVQGVELHRVHPGGLFEGVLPDASLPLRYELEIRYPDGNTFTTPDPYSFPPTLSDLDEHLFREGRHEQLWSKMGAHVREIDGAQGTSFAVWAPAARKTDTANKQTSEKTHNGKTGRNREQGKEKQKTKEKQIVIKRKCKRR